MAIWRWWAALLFFFHGLALAGGGLDAFLSDLDVRARADPADFRLRVGAQFQLGDARLKVVFDSARRPADVFMILELARMSRRPVETVLRVYRDHPGQGWGHLAKELGIKPGSREFHALKQGDFHLAELRERDGNPPGNPGEARGRGPEEHPGLGHGRGQDKHGR